MVLADVVCLRVFNPSINAADFKNINWHRVLYIGGHIGILDLSYFAGLVHS